MKCTVVGAGAWGTALANLLAENGNQTTLWAFEPDVSESVSAHRTQPGEPACRAAEDDRARPLCPTLIMRVPGDGQRVGDVELAPATTQRLLVGAPVPGGPAMVRHHDRPTARQPVVDAWHEGYLPLVGRPAGQPNE